MNRFQSALHRKNSGRPPVWFMRQAGRYHSHYQKMKERYSFIELCKNTDAACETAMGPIEDFDFDAAILFSDLLFPLESMGMGLKYQPGPQLDWHLKTREDVEKLATGPQVLEQLQFQGEALAKLRKALPQEKGLLGFVGGPLTLFFYAVAGSHKGDLTDAHAALLDGRYERFHSKIVDLLAKNMQIQAEAGADTIAVLDTCAGEISPTLYREIAVPSLKAVLLKFKELCPDTPITYYSKKTGPEHWESLKGLPISGKGVDWNHDITDVLKNWGDQWAIQGNVDPDWLFLDSDVLEKKLREIFLKVKELPADLRKGWICGLGHGVLPKTPEKNVRLFLQLQKEIFTDETESKIK